MVEASPAAIKVNLTVIEEADLADEDTRTDISTQEAVRPATVVPPRKNVLKKGMDEFESFSAKKEKYQLYYERNKYGFSDALVILQEALNSFFNVVNFSKIQVKVGHVESRTATGKWCALRLEIVGIGIVKFRTLIRDYFDLKTIDETRVTTR